MVPTTVEDDQIVFIKDYIYCFIVSSCSNLPANKYVRKSKPIICDKNIFEKIFKSESAADYKGPNGERLIISKYGDGYNTTKQGYIDLPWVWATFTEGKEIIGENKNCNNYNRIHTFDCSYSAITFSINITCYFSKRSCNGSGIWDKNERVPKTYDAVKNNINNNSPSKP